MKNTIQEIDFLGDTDSFDIICASPKSLSGRPAEKEIPKVL